MSQKFSTKQIVCLAGMVVLIGVGGFMATHVNRPDATTQASPSSNSKQSSTAPAKAEAAEPQGSHVTVSFPFDRIGKKGSDQFAIWVEDSQGNLVRTVVVTKYTATKGAAKDSNCLPTWSSKSGIRSNPGKIDVATGATPASGTVHYYWDLTDQKGTPVKPGTYKIMVEATQNNTEQLLTSADVAIGGKDFSVTVNPKLNGAAPQKSIVGNVTITYKP
jgi:hypothetical protein